MENILIKYNALDRFSQQLVDDFIELLAKRQLTTMKKTNGEKSSASKSISFDYSDYQKQLLNMQPWSIEEIKSFDENLALFSKMSITEW